MQGTAFTIARDREKPAIGGSAIEAKWNLIRSRRNERFEAILHAVDRLIAWSKSECHAFPRRIFGVAPIRSLAPVQQCDGLPDVSELEINLGAKDEGEYLECDDDDDDAYDIACSFAPKTSDAKRLKTNNDNPIADLGDSDFVSKTSDVYEAALSLAEAIEMMAREAGDDTVVEKVCFERQGVKH